MSNNETNQPNLFTRFTNRNIGTVLLLVVVFVAGFVFGNLNTISEAQTPFAIGDVDEAFEPFWEAYSAIQVRFVDADEVDVPSLVNGAISGMVDSLGDRNSLYYSPQEYNNFNTSLSGDMEGIGVVITTNEETNLIEVVTVLKGAPAEDAGVMPGDVFWEVDGVSVTDVDQNELATLVRGPAGSMVNIVFKRGEEFIELNIERASFEVPNITTDILENNIAYIRMEQFNQLAGRQLRQALEEVDANNRNGLIFDLRDNPGGLLSSAIDVGSIFIEDGVLVYESFGDGREEEFDVTGEFENVTVPIVVLVNEGSASASELVSGAMQDYEVATILGEVTFGKGTVQNVQPLSNGGGLRLTIARYLLPSRRWIHDVGVTPDIIVEYNPVEDGTDVDPQLNAALNLITTGSID